MANLCLDDAEPSGATAVRLSDEETAALIDALAGAQTRTGQGDWEDRLHLDAAARKISSLIGAGVYGLEIHAVSHRTFDRHDAAQ